MNFRRTFDPRLTEEYQQACAPYARQSGDAEVMSMAIGASLWATALQTSESGAAITKTAHIGCQWGYGQLVIETDSPIFHLARATGLTVASWQDVIMVNQTGKRFWNELDGSYNFIAAAMAYNGDPDKLNGGGPIWAIFDADAVAREKWNPKPPNVDPLYFASGATLKELAANINNPYQKRPMPGTVLQETVERYNSFVTSGVDTDFKKPKPMYKIEKPPFYAAWATPILHDSLTGLRVNTDQQVIDIYGQGHPRPLYRRRIHGWFGPAWPGQRPRLRPHRWTSRRKVAERHQLTTSGLWRRFSRERQTRWESEPCSEPCSTLRLRSSCCRARWCRATRFSGLPFTTTASCTVVDALVQPWSIAFLPGGDMLITERPGRLRIVRKGKLLPQPVDGVPPVFHSSQGGLLEVMPHPNFAANRLLYLSYSKPGADDSQSSDRPRARPLRKRSADAASNRSSRRSRGAATISAARSRSTGTGSCF